MNVKITDIDGKKPSFVQWDVDRVLLISGVDSQPALHFANHELRRAIVVLAEADGDHWTCKVPNFILQFAGPMAVSVFLQPDEGKTVATAVYPVIPKLKPQDYEYEENIGYLNWVVKSQEVQDLIDTIQTMLDNGELKGDPGPQGEQGPQGAPGADGATGPTGPQGNPGVYIGDTAPTDPDVHVWIDTSGDAETDFDLFVATYAETDGGDVATAYQAGKTLMCKYNDALCPLIMVSSTTISGDTFPVYWFGYALEDGYRMLKCIGDPDSYMEEDKGWSEYYTDRGVNPPTPLMDGAASRGSSSMYARADHVHPSNTSKITAPSSPATGAFLVYDGSAWVAKAQATEVIVSTAGAVSQALDAGKIFHFTGALTGLTITLNAAASGELAQYHFDFIMPATAFTPTLTGVTMPDGFEWEASKRYEVDVLNGYGVVVSWAVS